MSEQTPVTEDGEPIRPPGGIAKHDLERQAEVLRKASAACPIRQFRYWLADLAEAFSVTVEQLGWAEEEGNVVAVELAGTLTPGMKVYAEIGSGGYLTLAKINRRDGDWSLLLKCETYEQRQANNMKNDVWVNLKAGSSSPVVVLA